MDEDWKYYWNEAVITAVISVLIIIGTVYYVSTLKLC